MFDVPSLRIGKLFGIPLEVNMSWTIIFALVAFSLSAGYYPALPAAKGAPTWLFAVLGVLTAALFFGSIVLHELSHSLVARAQGGNVEKITLFIFGGVSEISEEPTSPGREFLMAVAGPAASLLLAGLCYVGRAITVANAGPWWLAAPLEYLAAINLFVGVFNLLPGFPLDGGRVLRSAIWKLTGDSLKATRWSARSGQLIGWAMVAISVVMVLGGRVDYVWFGLVGWFITWLAGASYAEQLFRSKIAGLTVGAVMTPSPEYVLGSITVENFVQEHLLGRRHSRYPVLHDGMIVGIVSLPDVKLVPRDRWPTTHVIEITNRDLKHLSVSGQVPVVSVLSRLAGEHPGALLVVRDGRLAGIVTRADVLKLAERIARS